MLKFRLFITVLLFQTTSIQAQFNYLNPLPNSKYHNTETSLAIKNGSFIDPTSIQTNDWLKISGSTSGIHQFIARLSDDKKTIIVKPVTVFNYGEKVTVVIQSLLRKESGEVIQGESYSFTIKDEISTIQKENFANATRQSLLEDFGYGKTEEADLRGGDCNLDSLPAFTINTNNSPAPGQIFYCNLNGLIVNYENCFPTIINNDGSVEWACDFGSDGQDFKINFNGYFTYYSYDNIQWYVMDSSFNIIDSIHCGNGYESQTNNHDISLYPNGHALLLAIDYQTIDMSAYGGKPDASVKTVIIQELDSNKDVVFEWSGWDHFQITDAAPDINLTVQYIDYVHGNALSFDDDGNLLLSCRSMNECTKIDRETGDIIWRLGGENNQFTFINDNIPEHFSHQHDVRKIENGNLTLFNNGNYLPLLQSSAKEYKLDEINKTATLVWYYEHSYVNGAPLYSSSTGSVQRLSNGNTLICWGTLNDINKLPSITEVDSNKNITWEMEFDQHGQRSYRAHKYIWEPCNLISSTSLIADNITAESANLSWEGNSKINGFILEYKKCTETNWIQLPLNETNFTLTELDSLTCYDWRVASICDIFNDTAYTEIQSFNTGFGVGLPLIYNTVSVFEVFPNPASKEVIATCFFANSIQVDFSLVNFLGVTFKKQSLVTATGVNKIRIDISSIPSGSYFLELKAGKQSIRKRLAIY